MLASRINYRIYGVFVTIHNQNTMSFVTDVKRQSAPSQNLDKKHSDEIYQSQQLQTMNLRSTLNTYSQQFESKWIDALSIYETFTHAAELRKSHEKINEIQNRLLQAQQRRIDILTQLTISRQEHQIIQDELANCTRSQDRYLGLVRLEIDVSYYIEPKLNNLKSKFRPEKLKKRSNEIFIALIKMNVTSSRT